jgi:hypothetical protein
MYRIPTAPRQAQAYIFMMRGYTRFPKLRTLIKPIPQPKKNAKLRTVTLTNSPSRLLARPSSKITKTNFVAPAMDTVSAARLTNMVAILSMPRVSTPFLWSGRVFLSRKGGTLGRSFCGVVILYLSTRLNILMFTSFFRENHGSHLLPPILPGNLGNTNDLSFLPTFHFRNRDI